MGEIITMDAKICTKCGERHPATLEFFHPNKRHKDGLQSACKQCRNEAGKAYRKKYPLKAKIRDAEHRKKFAKQRKISNANYRRQHAGQEKIRGAVYRGTAKGHLRTIYSGMKKRCCNSRDPNYKYYGGRGIKLLFTSDEFVDYAMNILRVDPRKLTIDRIDNNGNYEVGNIRFVTQAENNMNRRCTIV